MIKLVINGKPVPAGRPRFAHGHAYDPKTSRDYKKYIKQCARPQITQTPYANVPLKFCLDVYRPIQKSISKKEHMLRATNQERPIKKPDISNYLKLAEDALTGLAYVDDNLITTVVARKFYGETPRIEITIKEDETNG